MLAEDFLIEVVGLGRIATKSEQFSCCRIVPVHFDELRHGTEKTSREIIHICVLIFHFWATSVCNRLSPELDAQGNIRILPAG